MREIKIEYGFESVNGIVTKKYYLHEIPNIKEKCDVWNTLPIVYTRQFTGFINLDEIEIYVGDILSEKWKAEVYIGDDGAFMVRFATYPELNKPKTLLKYIKDRKRALCFDSDCKIIGNIHTTPELLNN